MVACKLAELLNDSHYLNRKSCDGFEQVFKTYFQQNDKPPYLEDFVLNKGRISVILHSTDLVAVVIYWDEKLTSFMQHCVTGSIFNWVIEGNVQSQLGEGSNAKNVDLPSGFSRVEIGDDDKMFTFSATPGSISVHVYTTSTLNIACYLPNSDARANRIVFCNSYLSVTRFEVGTSLSQLCSLEDVCNRPGVMDSLRLFSNLRDLIHLLHNEILPTQEGIFHSEAHINHILRLLKLVRIQEHEFSNYVRFQENKYTRNLVGYDVPVGQGKKAKFTVLILCWDKGQMSPIHDHAGSSCWVKVLQGQVREIRYDATHTPPKVIRDLTVGANDVCYINDTQGVHAMGNPSPDQVAVSMHIYAPPYMNCRLFDEAGEVREGNMSAAPIPSNPSCFEGFEMPCAESVTTVPEDQYVQLSEFIPKVKELLSLGCKEEVADLLRRLTLSEREWAEFVHFDAYRYTRSLIKLDSEFSLMILCWNKSQATPIHEHNNGMDCWVKVLRGSLQLKRYSGSVNNSYLKDSKHFLEGSQIDYSDFDGLHILGNASNDLVAVSLHLYSPPLVSQSYTTETGEKRIIPVVHSATSAATCCTSEPANCRTSTMRRTSSSSYYEQRISDVESMGKHTVKGEDKFTSLDPNSNMPLSDMLMFFKQDQDERVYTDLQTLVRFTSMYNLTNHTCPKQIAALFERMSFDPLEWHMMLDMDLLARGPTFSLWLRCWNADCTSEPCKFEHAGWLKILKGKLVITQLLDGETLNVSTIQEESVVFLSNKTEYVFQNESESDKCYALQLFKTATIAY